MISGEQLCYSFEDFEQPYIEKANKRRFLYHYTNFDSFLHIAMNQTLFSTELIK